MLLGAITARFAHGLLIIAAPESSDPHDDWDPVSEPFHAGLDSVYVGVLSAPSGLVSVEFFDGEEYPQDLALIYSGEMHLKDLKFLAFDPNETVLLTVLTDSSRVRISLFGDEPEDLSKVQVFVNSIAA
ncbi:hypothetical protein [Micromonospora chalcea]|uniref:hypothetical protein n=1 Tax=Micromonospora chalcea TaxID=1874 RepID=UPI001B4168CB|nr:hypothetical protein [Micromonospora sp. D75]